MKLRITTKLTLIIGHLYISIHYPQENKDKSPINYQTSISVERIVACKNNELQNDMHILRSPKRDCKCKKIKCT